MPVDGAAAGGAEAQAEAGAVEDAYSMDDASFSFITDFSKVEGILRFLLKTANEQSTMLRRMDAQLRSIDAQVSEMKDQTEQLQEQNAHMYRNLRMPDGRLIRDVMTNNEQDFSKYFERFHDQVARMDDIESMIAGKADSATTCDIKQVESLSRKLLENQDEIERQKQNVAALKENMQHSQTKDEFARRQLVELQKHMSNMSLSFQSVLSRSEMAYFLQSMLKRHQAVALGGPITRLENRVAPRPDSASTAVSDADSEKKGIGSPGKVISITDQPFQYAGDQADVKRLVDQFVNIYGASKPGTGGGYGYHRLGAPAVASRGAKSPASAAAAAAADPEENFQLRGDLDKLQFLVNMKMYKHEVHELLSHKVSRKDLEQVLQEYVRKPNRDGSPAARPATSAVPGRAITLEDVLPRSTPPQTAPAAATRVSRMMRSNSVSFGPSRTDDEPVGSRSATELAQTQPLEDIPRELSRTGSIVNFPALDVGGGLASPATPPRAKSPKPR